jgi:RHS repeat-associated protein
MTIRGVDCSGYPSARVSVKPKLRPARNDASRAESQQYFYHPDHLGSSSFVTDAAGLVEQHMQYLPFGELFVNQQNSTYDTRYKFSAKELDPETNYSYFGARYYDSDLSVWLSVDQLADKYPGTSPYMYVMGNPLKLIDPSGMNPEDPDWFKTTNPDGSTSVKWNPSTEDSFTDESGEWTNIGETYNQELSDGSYVNYYQNYAVSITDVPKDAKKQVLSNQKVRAFLMSNKSNLPMENKIDLMKQSVRGLSPDMQAIQIGFNGFFAGGALFSITVGRIGDDAFFAISLAGGVGGDISADVSYMSGTYYDAGTPTKKSFEGYFYETSLGAGPGLGLTGGIWGDIQRTPSGRNDKYGKVWQGTQFGISGGITPVGGHVSYGYTWVY